MFAFLITVIQDFAEQISIKYKGLMMKLSLQITGNHEDAEEAFQDALLSIYNHQSCIDDIDSDRARNYIYTVTRNAALKKRLKQSHYDNTVTFSDIEGYIDIEGEPDIDAFRDEYGFSEELTNTIKSISIEDYDLICYHYGAGYSYHEISKITGVSSSTLRKRMERCKSKLAKILDEEK